MGKELWGGKKRDAASAITSTKDGGFIVVGSTKSFGKGDWDVYILKIDKDGNKIWERIYRGSKWDVAYAIAPTGDGGFIVAGYTESFGNGGEDVYLIKIDRNGNNVWEKTYGGSKDDGADGGFIVAGLTKSFGNGGKDVYLIKIDRNGRKIWERTYGGSKDDVARAIVPTGDGGFIVAGYTKSFGNVGKDVYLIKIDKDGRKLWEKTYGGSEWDIAYAIVPTGDGGFIVAGLTESFGNVGWDVYLIKIKDYKK